MTAPKIELAWLPSKGHIHLIRVNQKIVGTCGRLHPFTNPPERERCGVTMRKKYEGKL